MSAVATAVRERPLLFSGEMVRALLAGRKTQTRRVVKEQPRRGNALRPILAADESFGDCAQEFGEYSPRAHLMRRLYCPYGEARDRLWVRETFRQGDGSMSVHYAADPDEVSGGPWRPSIFMPRWASRITLEVTEVRVQRLQDISEEDAQAEGITFDGTWWRGGIHPVKGTLQCWPHAKTAFARTWDVIQLQRKDPRGCSWKSNPWCWVITFRRIR